MTIEQAAVGWVAARHAAVRLKAQRNQMRCLVGDRDEPETGWRGTEACFKSVVDVPEDDPRDYARKPVAGWCAPCQQRQDIHDAYRIVAKAAGITNRALQAKCRAQIRRGTR